VQGTQLVLLQPPHPSAARSVLCFRFVCILGRGGGLGQLL